MDVDVLFYADNTANSHTFGPNDLPSGRPTSPVYSEWTIPADEFWDMGEMRDTEDFGPVVQYVLGLTDWSPGNGLTIVAKSPPYPLPTGTDEMSRHRRVMALERVGYVTPVPAELVVEYSGVDKISCEQGGLTYFTCADAFYNLNEWPPAAKGVQANMESARPVIRQPDYFAAEAMRVMLTSAQVGSGSADKGFVEIGWGYTPHSSHGDKRYVYVSYECADPDPNYSCYKQEILFDLPDEDYDAHNYRVERHYFGGGLEQWAFFFDGDLYYPKDPWEMKIDFDQGLSVGCGGETTRPEPPRMILNNIGPAACLDVSYTRSVDGDYYPVWSPFFRVDGGSPYYYAVTVISRNSWQSCRGTYYMTVHG